MKLILNNSDGEIFTVNVEPTDTFQDLKSKVESETGFRLDLQQLNVDGNAVSVHQKVSDFFSHGEVIADEPADGYAQVSLLSCAVPECSTMSNLLFPFPFAPDRCRHWAAVCGRYDLIDKPTSLVSTNYAICSRHFISESFEDLNRQSLKDDAIPTIFDRSYKTPINPKNFNCRFQKKQVIGSQGNATKKLVRKKLKWKDYGQHKAKEVPGCREETTDGCVCRLCGNNTTELTYIFGDVGEKLDLADKINTALPVTVTQTDLLPKQVCATCVEKVNACYDFAESCLQVEKTLKSWYRKNMFRCRTLNGIVSHQNIANHHNCDKEVGLPYSCPLCCTGKMSVCDSASSADKEVNIELTKTINSSEYSNLSLVSMNQNSIQAEKVQDSTSISKRKIDSDANNIMNNTTLIMNSVSNGDVTECLICGLLFDSLSLCLNHAADHAASDIFPCTRCDLCFSNNSSFRKHAKEHMAEDHENIITLLQCGICEKGFDSEVSFNKHACISSARPHKCLECKKFFRTEARLLFHLQCHQNASMCCDFCNKEFSNETNLFEHIKLVHAGERSYRCHICEKSFQLKSRLISHLHVHNDERLFECSICNGKFYDYATLKGHLVTHLEVKPFQCDKCGKCFSRNSLFREHVKRHSSGMSLKTLRTYKCKLCEATFPSLQKISEHRREAHSEQNSPNEENMLGLSKPFTCEICGKSFAYRVTLIAHHRVHTGEMPHQCQICNKRFTQKRSLVLHHRTHTGEKPYQCSVCGKRFVQSAHLYSHQRLHTGEKPYPCQLCGQRFRLKDVRDAHQRKHTGERPYKCSICEKAFRTSHAYYQHMWIHEGRKPYPCKYCGKAFRRSNGLKIHIRIHTGEKPHTCDVCNRSFAQKQDMKKHRNIHLIGKA